MKETFNNTTNFFGKKFLGVQETKLSMKIERKKGLREVKIEHNRILFWIIIGLLAILIGILIYIKNNQSRADNSDNNFQLANPASVYCIENGGRLEIRNDASGGQQGICILKNGTECDEWKYYRGEC